MGVVGGDGLSCGCFLSSLMALSSRLFPLCSAVLALAVLRLYFPPSRAAEGDLEGTGNLLESIDVLRLTPLLPGFVALSPLRFGVVSSRSLSKALMSLGPRLLHRLSGLGVDDEEEELSLKYLVLSCLTLPRLGISKLGARESGLEGIPLASKSAFSRLVTVAVATL